VLKESIGLKDAIKRVPTMKITDKCKDPVKIEKEGKENTTHHSLYHRRKVVKTRLKHLQNDDPSAFDLDLPSFLKCKRKTPKQSTSGS
jgi:hypothetical protein